MDNAGTHSVSTGLGTKRVRRAPQPCDLVNVPGALLRIDTVEALVGRGRSSIYARVKDGSFPQPVRLSARCIRWKSDVIRDYLAAL